MKRLLKPRIRLKEDYIKVTNEIGNETRKRAEAEDKHKAITSIREAEKMIAIETGH